MFQSAVIDSLNQQISSHIWYQDGYYVGGDPPSHIGVCTEKEVNLDIRHNPKVYGVSRPDRNIDHRRCKDIAVFFSRHAKTLPITQTASVWQPGDIVFWSYVKNGPPSHVGVISDHFDQAGMPTIVHGWPGQFVMEQDWLFKLPVVRHYRWISKTS